MIHLGEMDLAMPLIVAVVFTLGGYGIVRAERHAEAIGAVLGCVFVNCAVLAVLALLGQISG